MSRYLNNSSSILAIALVAIVTPAVSHADCGFIGCIIGSVPVIGPPLQQGGDALSRGIRERTSSESVYNQIQTLPATPFRSARPGLATLPSSQLMVQSIGAFCYTRVGRFGPGPVQPFGAQCFINGPQGPLYGQVGP